MDDFHKNFKYEEKRDLIFEKDGLVLQNMISNRIRYFVLIKKIERFRQEKFRTGKKKYSLGILAEKKRKI